LSAALVAYYAHTDWTENLGAVSRTKRRQILEKLRAEFGIAPLAALQREHIQALLNRLKPNAQKNWTKALRGFLKFCVTAGLIKADPTQGVTKARAERTEGFVAWTEENLELYRARWPLGTRQRLAVELMVNLGLRRSDACRIGPADIRGGYLVDFVPQKTARTTGMKLTLPVRPELAAAIAAMKVVSTKTFMVGEARGRVGQPFKTGESFGAWMRAQCDAAGLPDCTSHGLRKLAAIRLALAGCTVPELCKVFGWSSPAMAQVYVDQADQMRMANQAFSRLDATQARAQVSPTPSKRLGKTGKTPAKSRG
jgi:integrase